MELKSIQTATNYYDGLGRRLTESEKLSVLVRTGTPPRNEKKGRRKIGKNRIIFTFGTSVLEIGNVEAFGIATG